MNRNALLGSGVHAAVTASTAAAWPMRNTQNDLKTPWMVRPIETRWNPHVVVVVCVLLVRLIGQFACLREV